MEIRTTARIELSSYLSLINFTNKRKLSISKLMSVIIKKYISHLDSSAKPNVFQSVKYQPKGLTFKTIHIRFDAENYEACTDFRKYSKFSVSWMLNDAIMSFFEKNSSDASHCYFVELFNSMDNYVFIYNMDLVIKSDYINYSSYLQIVKKT